MNNTQEQDRGWKPCAGYEGHYEVSTDGLIRRSVKGKSTYRGRILKNDCATGYNRVYLHIGGKVRRELVHRLVAKTFLPVVVAGQYVNHIDGNKTNNRVENLEWATPRENTHHAWRTGLCSALKGEQSGHSKLRDDDVHLIRCAAEHGIPIGMIARRYGVTYQTIYMVATFKTWRHIKPETEVA